MLPLTDLTLVRAVEEARYRPAVGRTRRRRRGIGRFGVRPLRPVLSPCPTC